LAIRKRDRTLTTEEASQFDAFRNEVFRADKELAHLVDAIAGMAAVDGAVLFSADLEVLGFGVRIPVRSEVAGGEVEQLSISHGRILSTKRKLDAFGMRHLSAYEFVALAEGVIAFVLFQDGQVRAFVNSAGNIELYDCLEFTDVEPSLLPLMDSSPENKT
jgi:hypothetical protein